VKVRMSRPLRKSLACIKLSVRFFILEGVRPKGVSSVESLRTKLPSVFIIHFQTFGNFYLVEVQSKSIKVKF
jgi:hypothetical protein